ncbi:response regulator transcription factor [Sulfurimonas sp.]|uniref:response regulator transcription factor n=1 Tax=Sulfurimonas sp. TaxID=2022749 RepID=UPI002B470023|nr:response regulator transcription factor [Sulfurimonas sp.]
MARILLVEDDQILSETLLELLEDEGYDLTLAQRANEALDATYSNEFELMLLDVNIPDMNGFELLQMLRSSGNTTPSIFLTSLNDIASLSRGFEVGADDYIKKPFDFDELIIRIQALLRKSFNAQNNEVKYNSLVYKISTNELLDAGKLIQLAPQEQKLLSLLFKRIDETITKQELLHELDSVNESSEGALRVYITKLRKVGLEIQTIKGTGYRLVKA